MLTEKEIDEIRQEMDTARRPLIFFDDDTDGLSSFLMFYKYMKPLVEDIKGIPVKDSPVLRSEIFLRKIEEFSPDKIFVLDKPLIDQEFLDNVKQKVIWLDHHPLVERKGVHYYNPLKHVHPEFKPDNRPTTYWSFIITGSKPEDLWTAMVGCTGGWFVPEFYKDFTEAYPELLPSTLKIKNPGTVLHETELGRLCRIIQFNMKCNTQEVIKSIKILTRITQPAGILEQTTPQGKFIYKQFMKINRVYEKIKAEVVVKKNDPFVVYEYNEKIALTGDLANEVQYFNPNKVIIIARQNNTDMVCSLRSQNIIISDVLKESLKGIRGHGGGHEHACGAGMVKEDFPQFLENMKNNLKHKHKE